MSQMLASQLNVTTQTFEVHEVPIPEPGHGQVRIKVEATSVCLSDMHLIDKTLSPVHLPNDEVTLGHEVTETIEALGANMESLAESQQVLLQAREQTRDNTILTQSVDYDRGWAELALARHDTVLPIPDAIPFEQACIIPNAVSTP